MTNTSFLATSVEATRLRRVEEGEDFFHHSTQSEQRAYAVSQALEHWAPSMSAHWLGSDKFILTITEPEHSFAEAFHLEKEKAFSHVEQLTPVVLYVRCLPPQEQREQPERYVLEVVAMAFLPF